MIVSYFNNYMRNMGSKEYFLKLSEDFYNSLHDEEQKYLNHLGLEVRQIATNDDLEDESYKRVRKHRIDAWNDEQKFLFNKRNK